MRTTSVSELIHQLGWQSLEECRKKCSSVPIQQGSTRTGSCPRAWTSTSYKIHPIQWNQYIYCYVIPHWCLQESPPQVPRYSCWPLLSRATPAVKGDHPSFRPWADNTFCCTHGGGIHHRDYFVYYMIRKRNQLVCLTTSGTIRRYLHLKCHDLNNNISAGNTIDNCIKCYGSTINVNRK